MPKVGAILNLKTALISQRALLISSSRSFCVRGWEAEKKLVQAEMREQKSLDERNALQAKVAKMKQEQQQQQQQQKDSESHVYAFVDAFVDQFIKLQSDHQKTILESIGRMERAQQQKMDALKEQIEKCAAQTEPSANISASLAQLKASHEAFVAKVEGELSKLQQNCWDASACHADLSITGPNCSDVHYKGNGSDKSAADNRSVFTKHSIMSINSRIFYFEVKVNKMKGWVAIGLATKAMPLNGWVGGHSGGYGYESGGHFYTNGSLESKMPTFSAGDVVGFGVNLATHQIILTKNGKRLDVSDLFISFSSICALFPCVTLDKTGDKIAANFGPNFQFNVGTL